MMKKYLFTILISLILVLPISAYAVRQVPGNLPQTSPLQPIPIDTTPNVSHNVQNSPQTSAVNANQSAPNNPTDQNLNNPQLGASNTSAATGSSVAGTNKGNTLIIIIFVVVFVAAIIILWLRRRKK